MARNRTIYQSESLYAGPSPATGRHGVPGGGQTPVYGDVATQLPPGIGGNPVRELFRVQSCNYSYNIPRTDINQFNQLAAIDRVIIEQPTVSLDFSYILANMYNEASLGFTVSSGSAGHISAISGILNKTSDERNYFILTVPEGNDAASYALTSNNVATFAIGNGFITSYSTEASVGNFPTVTVNVEALNLEVDVSATGQPIPAVNPVDGTPLNGWYYWLPTGKTSADGNTVNTSNLSVSALRPGDITLTLGTEDLGPKFSDLKVQNYTLSFVPKRSFHRERSTAILPALMKIFFSGVPSRKPVSSA